MSPTALGVLPSNAPIPNQRCQMAVGLGDVPNHWQAGDAGVELPYMNISVTPTYDCWWVVRTNQIACGVSGGWQRWDIGMNLSPADRDGYNFVRVVTCDYDSGTVGWCTWAGHMAWRLAGGTAYRCALVSSHSSGGIQQSYNSGYYSRLIGVIYGEGVD